MTEEITFVKPQRYVKEVFFHHSASKNPNDNDFAYINRIAASHSYYDGHPDYHFFIGYQGQLVVGRPLELKPQAQALHNTGTIAICVGGIGDSFTSAQRVTAKKLADAINKAYDGKMRFRGHKEVNSTLCPSYPYKEWLNLDANGHIIA